MLTGELMHARHDLGTDLEVRIERDPTMQNHVAHPELARAVDLAENAIGLIEVAHHLDRHPEGDVQPREHVRAGDRRHQHVLRIDGGPVGKPPSAARWGIRYLQLRTAGQMPQMLARILALRARPFAPLLVDRRQMHRLRCVVVIVLRTHPHSTEVFVQR